MNTEVKDIDLSENKIGFASVQLLVAKIESKYCSISRLNLERTNINDFHVAQLCAAL
jgi:hypothetical protein